MSHWLPYTSTIRRLNRLSHWTLICKFSMDHPTKWIIQWPSCTALNCFTQNARVFSFDIDHPPWTNVKYIQILANGGSSSLLVSVGCISLTLSCYTVCPRKKETFFIRKVASMPCNFWLHYILHHQGHSLLSFHTKHTMRFPCMTNQEQFEFVHFKLDSNVPDQSCVTISSCVWSSERRECHL